ncbi:MAG: FAD-binding protein [Hyphomicrobiaceae bacterium]|nr:FAD-binding protein [Hyphomicrobiaceae bacterium]
MIEETFDAIVVGAGPAGNACAHTMASRGLKVLQLERGEYPGSKNVQGAILYADALEKVIPDFREDAPLERHVIEQRLWMMNDRSVSGMQYRSDDFNEELPNRYTIIRAQFDKWFSRRVQAAGALVICETTVTELVRNSQTGRVIGVRTDRAGGFIKANVVVLAEGVNGLIGERAGLRERHKPNHLALAVKEMHFLPRDTLEARFNLQGDEGVVIEAAGTITKGMTGTAFIYTNKESLSVGIGCLISDFEETGETPYGLLESFRKHPAVAPLLADSDVKEYAAHMIPEGGYNAIPQLYGDGWVVVGDAGQFVNAVHREGSNLAMTTGRIAGEVIHQIKARRDPLNAENLALYAQKLEKSFVMKDLKKYRNLPKALHNKHLFTTYPNLISQALQTWFRVDGVEKTAKENEIVKSFFRTRKLTGLASDVWSLARGWR